MSQELYFSTDVESDGPIPGRNSMLSFATVVLDLDGREYGSFSRNLRLLDGAKPDPDTMAWWGQSRNKAAWEACRKDQADPADAMREYVEWVASFPGLPVFAAYPAGYDFLYAYWYIRAHGLESPFSFSALDAKSCAAAVLKCNYRDATKKRMPKRWFLNFPHTHVALDDAREQGYMIVNILREARGLRCLTDADVVNANK